MLTRFIELMFSINFGHHGELGARFRKAVLLVDLIASVSLIEELINVSFSAGELADKLVKRQVRRVDFDSKHFTGRKDLLYKFPTALGIGSARDKT